VSNDLRVVIGVPSGHLWEAKFATSLINLVSRCAQTSVPGYRSTTVSVVNVRSSILPKNRLDIVKAAKAAKATHLLFLDTDHTFPPELLHKWIPHGKMILAANCVTKSIPASPTARAKCDDPAGLPVYTDPDSKGLERVWRVGTGVMLLNMQIFDKIPLDAWGMPFLPHANTYQGEDWTFCDAADKAGFPIWIDHDMSKRIGHLGIYEYTHDVVGTFQKD
jgi:hypothetical protein